MSRQPDPPRLQWIGSRGCQQRRKTHVRGLGFTRRGKTVSGEVGPLGHPSVTRERRVQTRDLKLRLSFCVISGFDMDVPKILTSVGSKLQHRQCRFSPLRLLQQMIHWEPSQRCSCQDL